VWCNYIFTALCEAEVEATSRGAYSWPVTFAEMNETIWCQYGGVGGSQEGTVATRDCDERGQWKDSNLTECATFSESTLGNISTVNDFYMQ